MADKLAKLEKENEALKNKTEIQDQKLNTLMNRDKSKEFDIDTIFEIKNYDSLSSDSFLLIPTELKYSMLQLLLFSNQSKIPCCWIYFYP